MGGGDIGKALGNVTDAVGLTNYSGERAQEAQQNATNSANQTLRGMYDQQRADMEPWRQSGAKALTGLEGNFMANWQQDPGYEFRMNEGNKAINNAAAARGMGNSGATMKALTKYGQDYASSEYDKAYNRNFNRLSTLAGFGNNASATNAANAGNYGQGVAANAIGMGNASASNQIAGANRMSNLINSGMQAAGQAASSGGAAAMFSDERLKENITPISKEDLSELKNELKAFYFEYKDKLKHGSGRWIGILAQDLEKTKLGKEIVVENEHGEKMIDINKVMSLFLATLAEA